jgi:hypothetical protein
VPKWGNTLKCDKGTRDDKIAQEQNTKIRMFNAKSTRGWTYKTHERKEEWLQNCEGNIRKEKTILENWLYKARN